MSEHPPLRNEPSYGVDEDEAHPDPPVTDTPPISRALTDEQISSLEHGGVGAVNVAIFLHLTIARLERELAEAHAHLEAQRRETYASVEREQRLKRELEQAHGNYAIQKAAADKAEERAEKLQARIVQLETEADAVAWQISPAMAQATIDRLEQMNCSLGQERVDYLLKSVSLEEQLAERDARITELEGDFLIVTEQRLALTAERDAAVARVRELEGER